MAITLRTLRSAAARPSRVIAKSLSEAASYGLQTAFLCHSHKDKDLAAGLQNLLKENGWNLYIDWQDNEMPESPDKNTATKIKSKIGSTKWFLFLAGDAGNIWRASFYRPCQLVNTGPWPHRKITVGSFHRIALLKCFSRVTENCHARFLGGKGAEKPLTYPVSMERRRNR